MQIELSEILTCPDCRSPQGLIVLVDELGEEGRVRDGHLGCARCQRRYPVREGVVDLRDDEADGGAPAGEVDRPSAEDLAVEVGGLLDLRGAGGPVVLAHGLASAAGPLSGLVEEVPLLALAGEAGPAPGDDSSAPFTLVLAPAGRLPLLAGKVEGVALWRPGAAALEDAVRALAPGARLAVLRPDGETRRELENSDLEVLASEDRAAVACRAG